MLDRGEAPRQRRRVRDIDRARSEPAADGDGHLLCGGVAKRPGGSPNNTPLPEIIAAIADEAQHVSTVIRRHRDFVRKGEIGLVTGEAT